MIEKEDYCEFCDGMTEPRRIDFIYQRLGLSYEIKDIGALVCNKCDEKYIFGNELEEVERKIKNGEFQPID